MPCRIELQDLELQLRIGCTAEERGEAQPVRVSAVVRSSEHFPACRTDRLADTLDAAEIRRTLLELGALPHVQTLERLGALAEARLRDRLPAAGLEWELSLSKPRFGWAYVHAWRT